MYSAAMCTMYIYTVPHGYQPAQYRILLKHIHPKMGANEVIITKTPHEHPSNPVFKKRKNLDYNDAQHTVHQH
jgi:hypothetical protein